ncbi:lysine decarboxylase [Streptococcus pneumoniae]|nr:lysine decarboxylase [Streptococcus pneumoniae]
MLASLDVARKRLATEGTALIEQTIQLAEHVRDAINSIEHLYCPGKEMLGTDATFNYDPTKIIVSVKDLGITGHQAEVWLREQYNIEVELSDLYNILCLITLGDTESDTNTLIAALQDLAATFRNRADKGVQVQVEIPEIPVLALSPRDAFYSETEVIPFENAAGRIIADFVMVYPPGIPIFTPGEIITQENLEYIRKNLEAGLPVQGPEDMTLQTLRVIKEYKPIS